MELLSPHRKSMNIRKIEGIEGDRRDYYLYPKAIPPYEQSEYIKEVVMDRFRYHSGEGDMWPLTWAADDMIYGGAGDNRGCPMNIWKVETLRFSPGSLTSTGQWRMDVINEEPVNLKECCHGKAVSVKPSGILDIDGTLYLSVEAQNYGENPLFCRQRNLYGWIVKSSDKGKTFEADDSSEHFFENRIASCHFLQFGKGYSGARDGYVYAYFPYDKEDGNSYWENNDALLLGRVLCQNIMKRDEWEFYSGMVCGVPVWNKEEEKAVPVFEYYKMTGANHVSYNPGIKRYIMGNYSFIDENLNPRPIHQMRYPESHYSQLTLYEALEPWGPWKLFYRDDRWGTYGDYQPNFPTKWMTPDGRILYMVSSGSWNDYNFVVQKMALRLAEDRNLPNEAKYFKYEI